MMGMSPLSRAKFRHRTDSNDWDHLNLPKGVPMKKRLNLIAELKKKDTEKEWSIDDFDLGRLHGEEADSLRESFGARPFCHCVVSAREVQWCYCCSKMYNETKGEKVQGRKSPEKRN